MATTVTSVTAPKVATPQPSFCSKLAELVGVILQVALRVLFIAGAVWMALELLPFQWSAIGVPSVAFGASILSSFFFPSKKPPSGPYFEQLPPLIRPIQGTQIRPQLAPLPVDAPRGLINLKNNCSFNSLVHFLEGVPAVAAFLRHPPKPEGGPLLKAYADFLAGYDQALRENRTPVDGTQNLRLALSQLTPSISPSESHQEDAPEILTQILDILPNEYKAKVEQAIRYAVGDHPMFGFADGTSIKEDRIGYFTLELKEEMQSARLEELFAHFCDFDVEHPPNYNVETNGVLCRSAGGEPRRYRPEHTKIRFLEAPPALFFQIKRFYHYDGRFSSVLPNFLLPGAVKREVPVEVPEELTIDVAGGTKRKYRLSTYVNQWGPTTESGHYTAAGIKNGQKYFMDDQSVTLADQASWDARARQAYLLCYVPVP